MASTNKTTNLKLSQFLGTDKPAWLTDYNADMQKIDDGYKKQVDDIVELDGRTTDLESGLSDSNTEIATVKNDVQSLKDEDVIIKRDINTLSTNYDAIHHETAINTQSIEDAKLKDTKQDNEIEKIRNGYMPKTGGEFTGPISIKNSNKLNISTQFNANDITENQYCGFVITDNNNNPLLNINQKVESNGGRLTTIYSYIKNTEGNFVPIAVMNCLAKTNGTAISYVQTPPENAKSDEAVTAEWVRNLLVSLGISGAAINSLDVTKSEDTVSEGTVSEGTESEGSI